MAVMSLIRIDSRLIHGQVIAKWQKQINANKIIIIDNDLPKDPFMTKVYTMAAPPSCSVEILSVEDSIKNWNENQFGEGKVLVLFKNVENAFSSFEKGLSIENLQVGGLAGGLGRKNVFKNIAITKEEVDVLLKMEEKGVNIIFQTTPEDKPLSLEKVSKKF